MTRAGRQLNLTLDDDLHLALRLLAERDDTSVQELVRPVIADFAAKALGTDTELAAAVEAMKASRARRRRSTRVRHLPGA